MKKEVVLITGGSGLLAKHAKKMLQDDYTVRLLTTNKKKLDEEQFYYWDIEKKHVDLVGFRSQNAQSCYLQQKLGCRGPEGRKTYGFFVIWGAKVRKS